MIMIRIAIIVIAALCGSALAEEQAISCKNRPVPGTKLVDCIDTVPLRLNANTANTQSKLFSLRSSSREVFYVDPAGKIHVQASAEEIARVSYDVIQKQQKEIEELNRQANEAVQQVADLRSQVAELKKKLRSR